MTGKVVRSVNNIYSVLHNGEITLCRIKGKVLESAKGEYNPIVVGDIVEFNSDNLILSRMERKGSFERWNPKKQQNQTICANMKAVVCVLSSQSPPFRPRFADRIIACCNGVECIVVLNKADLELSDEEKERFHLYEKLGYRTFETSSVSGKGIKELAKALDGLECAFVGQSGVGKSTLINTLLGCEQKTADVSKKYDRGCHTTTCALYLEGNGLKITDTPGFRSISVPHYDVRRIADSFPEIKEASSSCAFSSCTHIDEENCNVIAQVRNGKINSDRYTSYVNLVESLDERVAEYVQKNGK